MEVTCPQCRLRAKLPEAVARSSPRQCPRCGTQVAAAAAAVAAAFPWYRRTSILDLGSYWRTSKALLLRPRSTFGAINYDGGLGAALAYGFLYGSLGQILGRYWYTLATMLAGDGELGASARVAEFALATIFAPVVMATSVVIASFVVHLCLRLLGGASRPWRATLAVLAYSSGATALLAVIPLAGAVLIPFWALVLNCLGLASAHGTSWMRALFALLLPIFLAAALTALVIVGIAAVGLVEIARHLSF